MDETASNPRKRWLPRFSLFSALLLMTIVGLAIVVVQLWREVGPLRADVRRLRDEAGALSIDDPTKPCAIQVRTANDVTWKWRLWIPKGRAYVLNYASENIPKQGFPASHSSITLDEPGETWVEYQIAPDSTSGSGIWMDHLRMLNGASVGSRQQDWVKWKRRVGTGESVSYTTKVSEPGELITLARERVSQTATDSSKIEDPSAGFMIWLEPTK
jgi:hypothetical protein